MAAAEDLRAVEAVCCLVAAHLEEMLAAKVLPVVPVVDAVACWVKAPAVLVGAAVVAAAAADNC